MAILVAGCGYVGGALASELVAAGEQVFGLRRTASKVPRGVTAIGVDLLDRAALRQAIEPIASQIDALVYAASASERSDGAYARAYVEGLDNVLSALTDAPLERAIFTSSTAVYGQQEGWVDEDSATEPTAFSGKRLLEGEARLHEAPCATVALRLAGIYGPGRTRLVHNIATGTLSTNRYTNRIHRDDCAGALVHLLRVDAPPPVLVGVDDVPAPMQEVASYLAGLVGVAAPQLEGAVVGKRCRNSLLRKGYELRFRSYKEGYPEIVDGYLDA